MKRPCVDEVLKPLKPFQCRTVDHAFDRLFLADDGSARFLVADEVGLGKTLVARGVIARAIDHLWEKVERIDVVYVCSNGGIARANLPKLRIGGENERSFALSTRLTMLATELAPRPGSRGLADSRVNFVSFTPGTSFDMGRSSGQARERELLFHLLAPQVERRTALMNLLQGGKRDRDGWRSCLKCEPPLEPAIRTRFQKAFQAESDLRCELDALLDTWFFRYRQVWPEDARQRRNSAIARLRRLLAEACLHALEPDLVILDEFQRFKSLLESRPDRQDSAAVLAQQLFRATASDGKPVRTLLLSATPYKLYTADAEIERDDHYEDFLATTRFLLGDDDARVADIGRRLSAFRAALKRAVAGPDPVDGERVSDAKRSVESALGAVMTRTERVAASDDRDAMVTERQTAATLAAADVRQYLAADALFRAVDERDPMPFWKSAPYLAHFMRGYRFNDRLHEALDRSPNAVAEVLRRHAPAFLNIDAFRNWSTLDPGHAKLRTMVHDLLDARELWRLLWMPPTVSYWPPGGPFKGRDTVTKTLLFSAWNVVPDVVGGVLSYEAERRMVGDRGRITQYEEPAKQQPPLLRLRQHTDRDLSSHRLLLLLLPCLPLADHAHPLEAPEGQDRRAWVRARIEALLAKSGLPDPQDGEVDDRWTWAAPILLDPALREFLQAWQDALASAQDPAVRDGDPRGGLRGVLGGAVSSLLPGLGSLVRGLADKLAGMNSHTGEPDHREIADWEIEPPIHHERPRRQRDSNPGVVDAYLGDLQRVKASTLGRRPPDLVDLLTEVALGSPAILAARCLRPAVHDDNVRRRLAAHVAGAFWRLFNQPAVISLLRQLAAETGAARRESAYWRLVLRYCRDGNLQAVLDEQWHLLWEQEAAWRDGTDANTAAERCARTIADTVRPTRSRVHAHFLDVDHSAVARRDLHLRAVFALRFGHLRTDDDRSLSQDQIRAAFNSPFRPFVLASTSIGQEGLDFHPWCHRVIHWNLPGNPVDLEQREGRVHRYKGHAVRRNVAAAHGTNAFKAWRPGDDLWEVIFRLAERAARDTGESDLVPHWIAHGPHRVERHVPQLPYTAEVEAFERLKRQLAAYRVVFGQPRQEELLALLGRANLDVDRLRDWAIDLRPPVRPRRRQPWPE